MRRLADLSPPQFKSPVTVVVEGSIGKPLTVRVIDDRSGRAGVANSKEQGLMEEATGTALNAKSIAKAIGTLGNTKFTISRLDLGSLDDGLWCPMSWVKDTRRKALESLCDSKYSGDETNSGQQYAVSASYNDVLIVDQLLDQIIATDSNSLTTQTYPRISVLARNLEQVDSICNMIEHAHGDDGIVVSEVIVDFLEIEGITSAVHRIREVKDKSVHDLRIVVASPRVIKPGEEGIWRTLLKQSPDSILVRSTGLLYRLNQLGGAGQQLTIYSAEGEAVVVTIPELIGDFSLNAANAITAHELLQSGLSRITAAYDLSAHAITELATLLGRHSAQHLEVVIHQHMPIFHTEHCVFARFLSKGNSYQDCGHVCTRNTVHLRDQSGKDNLVLADMGCRNTVFMSEAQSGVYSINEWIKANVGHFRIELVDESGEDAVKIVNSYIQFLSKKIQAKEVWNELGIIADSNGRLGGVGTGSLRNSIERRSGELSSSVQ
jgi:putative protease